MGSNEFVTGLHRDSTCSSNGQLRLIQKENDELLKSTQRKLVSKLALTFSFFSFFSCDGLPVYTKEYIHIYIQYVIPFYIKDIVHHVLYCTVVIVSLETENESFFLKAECTCIFLGLPY